MNITRFLVLSLAASAYLAAQRTNIPVVVDRIGDSPMSGTLPVPVHRFESVVVRTGGSAPNGSHLSALIRHSGEHWIATGGADTFGAPNSYDLNTEFGGQNDDLDVLDFRVVVSRDGFTPGSVPDWRLSSPSVLGMSKIIRVQRISLNKPVLGIPRVNFMPAWEDDPPWVGTESAVEVSSTKLPIGAKIGLMIQAVRPLDCCVWVQDEELDRSGSINAHFGEAGLHTFVRYSATAFAVAPGNEFPPRGVPIPLAAWSDWAAKFLAVSTPVTVVKEAQVLTIETVNDRHVPSAGRIAVEPQVDIAGLLDRPLAGGETLWLICVPASGDPWVASPDRDATDNLWHAKAVQVWKKGRPVDFELVAVLSKDDATRVSAEQMRSWVNVSRHSANTVRMHVVESAR